MNQKRYNISILGAGESGVGAAILAKKQGLHPFVSDAGTIKQAFKEELTQHNIAFEEGSHNTELILAADEIIKSPGIPDSAPLLVAAKEKHIPIISEIEFAARYTDAFLVGITGTNGKTTTTMLMYHLFKNAGLNVAMAGNVGESFARKVATATYDYYILEISSFQLDNTEKVRFNIATILNITEDHLDRYDNDITAYAKAKFKITQNQQEEDHFIYCLEDDITKKMLKEYSIRAIQYSISTSETPTEKGAYIENNNLNIVTNNSEYKMSIQKLALQGKHNLYNSMAAGVAGRILEMRKEVIRESLSDFQNIEHRMEHVTTVCGVEYINDSKATNINSTWYALECTDAPIVWIVGGVDKGNDYTSIDDMVKEKVKAIICLGKDNSKLKAAFGDSIEEMYETESMSEAVRIAYNVSNKNETVLLSPACASFDLFENYEDRGRRFKEAVRSL